MKAGGPWTVLSSRTTFASGYLQVRRDKVKFPNGQTGEYDWFESPDQVRIAALIADKLLLIEQHHYLIGRCLQLPGGSVEGTEDPADAAKRELSQETGLHEGVWEAYGAVHPLPSMSSMRVHLWYAHDLAQGRATPEPTERDLVVVPMSVRQAVAEVRAGRVTCAASAALILSLAVGR